MIARFMPLRRRKNSIQTIKSEFDNPKIKLGSIFEDIEQRKIVHKDEYVPEPSEALQNRKSSNNTTSFLRKRVLPPQTIILEFAKTKTGFGLRFRNRGKAAETGEAGKLHDLNQTNQ